MELYRMTSAVNKFHHNHQRYDGVKMHWFVVNRRMPVVRYKTVIKDYDSLPEKDRVRPAELIKELFTDKEALTLKRYLRKVRKLEVEITPFELPVEPNCLGFRAQTVGESSGFYYLSQEKGYNLPFKVWGSYSVDGLEPIHDFTNIVSSVRQFLERTVRSIVGEKTIHKTNAVV